MPAKLDRCVQHLTEEQGYPKDRAFAICNAALNRGLTPQAVSRAVIGKSADEALALFAPPVPTEAQKSAQGDRFRVTIPFSKIDAERRMIYATASDETPDSAGEIMDYASSKPNFLKWSDLLHRLSGGKSRGNIREMHTDIAAGKAVEFSPDDDRRAFDVAVKVVDDQSWRKVEEGVLLGLSIGGTYGKRWPDPENPRLTRYEAVPMEISLVDLPANPNAGFKEVVKVAQNESGAADRGPVEYSFAQCMKEQGGRYEDGSAVCKAMFSHYGKADPERAGVMELPADLGKILSDIEAELKVKPKAEVGTGGETTEKPEPQPAAKPEPAPAPLKAAEPADEAGDAGTEGAEEAEEEAAAAPADLKTLVPAVLEALGPHLEGYVVKLLERLGLIEIQEAEPKPAGFAMASHVSDLRKAQQDGLQKLAGDIGKLIVEGEAVAKRQHEMSIRIDAVAKIAAGLGPVLTELPRDAPLSQDLSDVQEAALAELVKNATSVDDREAARLLLVNYQIKKAQRAGNRIP